MRLDDPVRLRHIVEGAQEAVAFAQGQTAQTLEADRMRLLALTRLIEIIGEATTALTPEYKASHPDIPLARQGRDAEPPHPRVFRR